VAYLLVEDFRYGMDRRRKRVAGVPGTLWLGKEVHVTRGGDIERRKPFVPQYDVAGTFGGFAIRSQPYVFGSADLAASMPAGVQYQRLIAPSSPAMTAILDVKSFSGMLYAIAEYEDGNVYHFYDGTRVTDWDVIADDAADFTTVAAALSKKLEADDAVSVKPYGDSITFTAKTPGTAFTIAQSTTDGGGTNDQTITLTELEANVAEVEEVVATATITITSGSSDPGINHIESVTIDDVELLSAEVDWTGSNESTAIRLAAEIIHGPQGANYTAVAAGAVVTISAFPGTGATPNGLALIVLTGGDVTVTNDASMAGGVTAVEPVAEIYKAVFSGTFEPEDTFTITLNGIDYKVTGRASATGRSAMIASQRVWSPVGSLFRFCMLLRADVWDPAAVVTDNDAGFLNVASETEGNEDLVGGSRYQGLTAMFSESSITLYQLDPDPTAFAFSQWLESTGTRAPGSIVRYGNDDVFYLDVTGIRSLRARDASNAPFVSDIGNAIDTFVQEYVASLPNETVRTAKAVIEPKDGRYWLVIGARIFVLSYFPGAKISAWSYYEPEEFGGENIQSVFRVGSSIYVRAGDDLLIYGGVDGDTLPEDDEVVAEVELPFLSAKTPATIKNLTGFDLAATNDWDCELAYDPNDTTKTFTVGVIERITLAEEQKISVPGFTSMVAPIMSCSKGGEATLSMLAIHYEGEEAPG
jgi:hypothetical protein